MSEYDLPPLPAHWEHGVTEFVRSWGRHAIEADRKRRGEPVAWLRNERDGYAGKEIFDPLVILGSAPPIKTANGATYSPVFAAPQPAEPTAAEISNVVREITGFPDIKNGNKSLVVLLGLLVHKYAAPQTVEPVKLCDCERGHNGMGMAGRECDCPAEPVKVPSDDQWQTLIGWLDRRRHYPTVQITGKVAGDIADLLARYGKGTP